MQWRRPQGPPSRKAGPFFDVLVTLVGEGFTLWIDMPKWDQNHYLIFFQALTSEKWPGWPKLDQQAE